MKQYMKNRWKIDEKTNLKKSDRITQLFSNPFIKISFSLYINEKTLRLKKHSFKWYLINKYFKKKMKYIIEYSCYNYLFKKTIIDKKKLYYFWRLMCW
jgi:hypothetical protein